MCGKVGGASIRPAIHWLMPILLTTPHSHPLRSSSLNFIHSRPPCTPALTLGPSSSLNKSPPPHSHPLPSSSLCTTSLATSRLTLLSSAASAAIASMSAC